MTFPDFFVIGAMKSGTTSLYHDLSAHPMIKLAEKESAGLERFGVREQVDRQRYARQWAGASAGQLCGDVSTTYTMLPHTRCVPELAAVVAPEARLIYILREPIDRIVSHHHHDVSAGVVRAPIDTAVREDSRFLDYSRYAYQLRAWTEHFPADAIRVVRFEDYIRDRRGVTAGLFRWLGLPQVAEPAGLEDVHNASEGKLSARGVTRRVVGSRVYRERVRPMVPQKLRSWVSSTVLPIAPPRPAPPSLSTVKWMVDQLRTEVEVVEAFTGGAVTWDLDENVAIAAARESGRTQ